MGQVGIPLFYLQGMGGGAVLKFRDLFNDSSQFWGWRLFLGEVSTNGKSGLEANGRYSLAVQSGYNGRWEQDQNEAPRLFMGVLTYPVEIKTRLDTFTNIEASQTGLFIASGAISFGAENFFTICQRRTLGVNNVCVVKDGTEVLATGIASVLPMWFRIRLGCGAHDALNAYFDYSLDGLTWVNLWVQATGWDYLSINPPATGIYACNFSALNICEASFDFFQQRPRSIN